MMGYFMRTKNVNSSDNYVKLEELNSKNLGVSDSESYMIIKLAIGRGESEQRLISSCCKAQECVYIPIYKNTFGILTDEETKRASGQEASHSDKGYNIKPFVDIYNCAKGHSLIPFWNSHKEPYASILLDNQYFLNLLTYCIMEDITINYVDFITQQGTTVRIDEIKEIKKEFRSQNPDKAIELSLSYDDNDIIIKKSGYVILASGRGTDFYDRNKTKIIEIISIGFLDKYGQLN
jgi:hypothetical protein